MRIGYLSPDFRVHCQAFFTVPLFKEHDREQVEICCYSAVDRPDIITNRLLASDDLWSEVASFSDEQVAQLIRQDRIDILVDLTMHMEQSRPLVLARTERPTILAAGANAAFAIDGCSAVCPRH